MRLFERSPDDILHEAKTLHDPVATIALMSGGGDSSAMLKRCRGQVDYAVYIDTGTALPGVEQHAIAVCDQLGVELRIYRTPMTEYDTMVLDHGFPGKAQHGVAYVRLKERRVEDVKRDAKMRHHRSSRVLLVSGARADESTRRMGTTKAIHRTPTRSQVWVNPLIDWSNRKTKAYRDGWYKPSDVQLLTHRSGECNCGAFASEGEREMLADLFPEWFERIAWLEQGAKKNGLRFHTWGGTPGDAVPEFRPMCVGCEGQTAIDVGEPSAK